MTKKVNCKHGLTPKEEIQARRLRQKLESNNKEEIEELKDIYSGWWNLIIYGKNKVVPCSFELYLRGYDIVIYSALMRSAKQDTIIFKIREKVTNN